MPKARPFLERFWEKVNIAGPDDCWEWKASRASGRRRQGKSDYGRFNKNNPFNTGEAHRIAYMLAYRPPPPDKPCVLHSCDNPPCCNPRHLWPGTAGDNNRDRHAKGRSGHAQGETIGNSKLNDDDVLAIRGSTDAASNIAQRFGITPKTVYDIQSGDTWKHIPGATGRQGAQKGEKRYNARLTPALVKVIRESDETCLALAGRLGVSEGAVDDARVGRTWKHLPGARLATVRSGRAGTHVPMPDRPPV